jgi:hypothetical protein
MLDDLSRVALTVAVARRTVRVALQAIGLGTALSLMLMVVAAFGLIPAIVGATLQEVVDLVAILGALRAVRPGPEEVAVAEPAGTAGSSGPPLLPGAAGVASGPTVPAASRGPR